VKQGRHPVVEKYQLVRGNSYIHNDAALTQSSRLWLLTGPNMGGRFESEVGKSTFLRQWLGMLTIAQ
jgi:DNA mismatch repair protein MutS